MQRVSAAGRQLAAAARPWLGELAAAGAGMMLAFLILGRHRIFSSLRGLRTGGADGGADSDEEAEEELRNPAMKKWRTVQAAVRCSRRRSTVDNYAEWAEASERDDNPYWPGAEPASPRGRSPPGLARQDSACVPLIRNRRSSAPRYKLAFLSWNLNDNPLTADDARAWASSVAPADIYFVGIQEMISLDVSADATPAARASETARRAAQALGALQMALFTHCGEPFTAVIEPAMMVSMMLVALVRANVPYSKVFKVGR